MKFQRQVRGRQRRGVSEIVSTLLLIAIVVTLGVLVFTFASGTLSSLTGNFAGLMSNRSNAEAEHFVIEQVTFCESTAQTGCGSGTGANVYVRNVGTISSTLVDVYIVDQSTNTYVTQVAISTTLNVGTVVDIPYTTVTFTPAHGNTYLISVSSNLGNSVTFDAEAT